MKDFIFFDSRNYILVDYYDIYRANNDVYNPKYYQFKKLYKELCSFYYEQFSVLTLSFHDKVHLIFKHCVYILNITQLVITIFIIRAKSYFIFFYTF